MRQSNTYRVRVQPEGSQGQMTIIRQASCRNHAQYLAEQDGYRVVRVYKQRA